MQTVIAAPAYALGEEEYGYRDIADYTRILGQFGYPDQPEVFGWGSFRKTQGDIFDLGIAAGRRTLAASGVAAAEIDLVLFCSTCFPGNEIEHIKFNARLLQGLGLKNAFPVGITLNNCLSFLSAINMANSLVQSGTNKNVLIITADKVYDESIRFNNFALLSDSAASCLVTAKPLSGLRLVKAAFGASDDPIQTNHGKDDSALYQRVLDELMHATHTCPGDIKRVFCNNIFRPVSQLKECRLGFSRKQLFLDNVSRYGHCFSGDTLINFVDYAVASPPEQGDQFVLAVDAPNLRANMLVQYHG